MIVIWQPGELFSSFFVFHSPVFQFDSVGSVKKSRLLLSIRFTDYIKSSKEESERNSTSNDDYNTKWEQEIYFNSDLRKGKLTPNNNSEMNINFIEKE